MIVITGKQILTKELSMDDKIALVNEYSSGNSKIAMYWGRVPNSPLKLKEINVPNIFFGDIVHYFIWDGISWIVTEEIAKLLLENKIILIGDWSRHKYMHKKPILVFKEDITHRIHTDHVFISDNEIKLMQSYLKNMFEELDMSINFDPQYHLKAIHYILEYHILYRSKNNTLTDRNVLRKYLEKEWVYSGNSIINGFIDVISDELTRYGYLKCRKDFHDFRRRYFITNKGRDVLSAMRMECLMSEYSEPYTHDFWDRTRWTDVDDE